jgi:thymidylate synthase (FAD)
MLHTAGSTKSGSDCGGAEMKIDLVDCMGDDLRVVNSARVSYAKESWFQYWMGGHEAPSWIPHWIKSRLPKSLTNADRGLINYLAKNKHGTPFECVVLTFRVKVPIFVAREWMRHRIASYNEVSTRYHEMEPEFYLPPPEDMRKQVGKPGHYTFEQMTAEEAHDCLTIMEMSYNASHAAYKSLLTRGLAKEVARNVLPLGQYTQFYWTVNLRSLFNFLALRNAPQALREIRYCAQEIELKVRDIVPESMRAWEENGRVAP